MSKQLDQDVQYHYDLYPTEEELMPESTLHSDLVHYLLEVLKWLFSGQICSIYSNLHFYQTSNTLETPAVPDLAIIKGIGYQYVKSWRIGKTGPPPQVVLEIMSDGTWLNDLETKHTTYASMGVQEYFAYDPNEPPFNNQAPRRLFGWRLDARKRQMVELVPNARGHLWSSQLDSWLVSDGKHLRLYDRLFQLRLKEAEAEAEARKAATHRAEALAEKLRSLGINPDDVA